MNREAFEKDDDCYFLDEKKDQLILLYRKDNQLLQLEEYEKEFIYKSDNSEIKLEKQSLKIKDYIINDDNITEVDLKKAAEMRVILEGAISLIDSPLSFSKQIPQLINENNSPFTKGARGIQKTPYLPYNKNLKKFSKNLRNDSTLGEVLLWKELRAKKLRYTFNRQEPILNYIVDFYCKPLNLVLEVDGSSHDNDEAMEKDTKTSRNGQKN